MNRTTETTQKDEKSLKDLNESLRLLVDHVFACYQGKRYHYTGVAVQLRKLLCDTQRGKDASLLLRCHPNIKFHPVPRASDELVEFSKVADGILPDKKLIAFSAATYCTGHPGPLSLFDEELEPIALSSWLDQIILFGEVGKELRKFISIRELIRAIADKEGAHSDKTYGDVLTVAKSTRTDWFDTMEEEHISHIVLIGEYLAKQVCPLHKLPYVRKTLSGEGRGYMQAPLIWAE